MSLIHDPRRGIRLIDWMVATAVIALAWVIVVPMLMYRPGVLVCRVYCQNNMRQLGLALLNFSTTKGRFPNAGTIRDDPKVHQGDPTKSNLYLSITDPARLPDGGRCWLSNWVVEVLPYLDQPDLANAWDPQAPYWWPQPTRPNQPANRVLSETALGVLRCPDDPQLAPGCGNLSYVVNGGFTRWPAIPIGWTGGRIDRHSANGPILRWTPADSTWLDSQAVGRRLGVMFLGTDTGDQPWDIKTTPADLVDGASQTLLIAENTLAGHSSGNAFSGGIPTNWACPLPNFAMFLGSDNVCDSGRYTNDCLGGQLKPRPGPLDGPGWALANRTGTFENINYGQNLTVKGSFPFASGPHPGGANFVFCDGATRFISATIDGSVYARLITPAGTALPATIRQGLAAPVELEP